MQIRRDLVFVSSVLFTIALVCVIPSQVSHVLGMHPPVSRGLDERFSEHLFLFGHLGLFSLTIILIGLIVIWAGYVKRVRWTWFVMFIIVFGWAFTWFMLPLFKASWAGTPLEFFLAAVREPGVVRNAAKSILVFSLMVIALFLPARSFFSQRRR